MKGVFRITAIVLSVVLLLAVGTLIVGAIAKSSMAKRYPAPGQLVDVGGYKMHINCTGEGSPTVILEAGSAGYPASRIVRQSRVLVVLSSTGFMALAPQAIPSQGLPDEVFAQNKVIWASTGFFTAATAEMDAIAESTAEVRALQITSFGNLPLSMHTAGV